MVHKTKKNKTKPQCNIYVGHHYTQTNRNNVKKTCALPQTTGGKDEPNIVSSQKSQRTSQHGTSSVSV